MVDCEVLTEFSKSVLVDNNRLLLESKNCDYTIEMYFLIYLVLSLENNAEKCKKVNPLILQGSRYNEFNAENSYKSSLRDH